MGISIRRNSEKEGKIIIATFPQITKAEIVKTYLESKGIICSINESTSNWLWPGVLDENAVKLLIDENMYTEVIRLLKEGGFQEYIIS